MRLLLSTDIRQPDERLIAQAGRWAEAAGATLDVVHVDTMGRFKPSALDPRLQERLTRLLASQRDQDDAALQTQLATLPAAVRGDTILLAGLPADVISELAEERDYDAVLVGEGRSAVRHLLLGSVANRLIRRVPRPVLVLRPCEEPTGRLLVAVDLDEIPQHVVEAATRWAVALGCRLDLIYVDDDRMESSLIADPDARRLVETEWSRRHQTRREQLEELMAGVPEAHRGEIQMSRGAAAAEIILWSRTYRAVVICTHNPRGLSRLFLGSVAERVARGAGCPVLVLRLD